MSYHNPNYNRKSTQKSYLANHSNDIPTKHHGDYEHTHPVLNHTFSHHSYSSTSSISSSHDGDQTPTEFSHQHQSLSPIGNYQYDDDTFTPDKPINNRPKRVEQYIWVFGTMPEPMSCLSYPTPLMNGLTLPGLNSANIALSKSHKNTQSFGTVTTSGSGGTGLTDKQKGSQGGNTPGSRTHSIHHHGSQPSFPQNQAQVRVKKPHLPMYQTPSVLNVAQNIPDSIYIPTTSTPPPTVTQRESTTPLSTLPTQLEQPPHQYHHRQQSSEYSSEHEQYSNDYSSHDSHHNEGSDQSTETGRCDSSLDRHIGSFGISHTNSGSSGPGLEPSWDSSSSSTNNQGTLRIPIGYQQPLTSHHQHQQHQQHQHQHHHESTIILPPDPPPEVTINAVHPAVASAAIATAANTLTASLTSGEPLLPMTIHSAVKDQPSELQTLHNTLSLLTTITSAYNKATEERRQKQKLQQKQQQQQQQRQQQQDPQSSSHSPSQSQHQQQDMQASSDIHDLPALSTSIWYDGGMDADYASSLALDRAPSSSISISSQQSTTSTSSKKRAFADNTKGGEGNGGGGVIGSFLSQTFSTNSSTSSNDHDTGNDSAEDGDDTDTPSLPFNREIMNEILRSIGIDQPCFPHIHTLQQMYLVIDHLRTNMLENGEFMRQFNEDEDPSYNPYLRSIYIRYYALLHNICMSCLSIASKCNCSHGGCPQCSPMIYSQYIDELSSSDTHIIPRSFRSSQQQHGTLIPPTISSSTSSPSPSSSSSKHKTALGRVDTLLHKYTFSGGSKYIQHPCYCALVTINSDGEILPARTAHQLPQPSSSSPSSSHNGDSLIGEYDPTRSPLTEPDPSTSLLTGKLTFVLPHQLSMVHTIPTLVDKFDISLRTLVATNNGVLALARNGQLFSWGKGPALHGDEVLKPLQKTSSPMTSFGVSSPSNHHHHHQQQQQQQHVNSSSSGLFKRVLVDKPITHVSATKQFQVATSADGEVYIWDYVNDISLRPLNYQLSKADTKRMSSTHARQQRGQVSSSPSSSSMTATTTSNTASVSFNDNVTHHSLTTSPQTTTTTTTTTTTKTTVVLETTTTTTTTTTTATPGEGDELGQPIPRPRGSTILQLTDDPTTPPLPIPESPPSPTTAAAGTSPNHHLGTSPSIDPGSFGEDGGLLYSPFSYDDKALPEAKSTNMPSAALEKEIDSSNNDGLLDNPDGMVLRQKRMSSSNIERKQSVDSPSAAMDPSSPTTPSKSSPQSTTPSATPPSAPTTLSRSNSSDTNEQHDDGTTHPNITISSSSEFDYIQQSYKHRSTLRGLPQSTIQQSKMTQMLANTSRGTHMLLHQRTVINPTPMSSQVPSLPSHGRHYISFPQLIKAVSGEKILSATLGHGFGCLVTATGRVLSFGSSSHGRNALAKYNLVPSSSSSSLSSSQHNNERNATKQGLDPIVSYLHPQYVSSLLNLKVINVACGWNHTLFLTETGDVFAVGCGLSGKTGLGLPFDVGMPQQINFHAHNDTPSQSSSHGSTTSTRLHSTESSRTSSSSSSSSSSAVSPTGTGGIQSPNTGNTGDPDDMLLNTSGITPITHSSLYRYPSPTIPIISISCGHGHSMCLDALGQVFTFGNNSFGQLGHGDCTNRLFPTKVIFSRSGLYHKQSASKPASPNSGSSGSGGTNDNDSLTNTTQEALDDDADVHIISISAGAFHSAAVSTAGELFVWGSNRYQQLGIGLHSPLSCRHFQQSQKRCAHCIKQEQQDYIVLYAHQFPNPGSSTSSPSSSTAPPPTATTVATASQSSLPPSSTTPTLSMSPSAASRNITDTLPEDTSHSKPPLSSGTFPPNSTNTSTSTSTSTGSPSTQPSAKGYSGIYIDPFRSNMLASVSYEIVTRPSRVNTLSGVEVVSVSCSARYTAVLSNQRFLVNYSHFDSSDDNISQLRQFKQQLNPPSLSISQSSSTKTTTGKSSTVSSDAKDTPAIASCQHINTIPASVTALQQQQYYDQQLNYVRNQHEWVKKKQEQYTKYYQQVLLSIQNHFKSIPIPISSPTTSLNGGINQMNSMNHPGHHTTTTAASGEHPITLPRSQSSITFTPNAFHNTPSLSAAPSVSSLAHTSPTNMHMNYSDATHTATTGGGGGGASVVNDSGVDSVLAHLASLSGNMFATQSHNQHDQKYVHVITARDTNTIIEKIIPTLLVKRSTAASTGMSTPLSSPYATTRLIPNLTRSYPGYASTVLRFHPTNSPITDLILSAISDPNDPEPYTARFMLFNDILSSISNALYPPARTRSIPTALTAKHSSSNTTHYSSYPQRQPPRGSLTNQPTVGSLHNKANTHALPHTPGSHRGGISYLPTPSISSMSNRRLSGVPMGSVYGNTHLHSQPPQPFGSLTRPMTGSLSHAQGITTPSSLQQSQQHTPSSSSQINFLAPSSHTPSSAIPTTTSMHPSQMGQVGSMGQLGQMGTSGAAYSPSSPPSTLQPHTGSGHHHTPSSLVHRIGPYSAYVTSKPSPDGSVVISVHPLILTRDIISFDDSIYREHLDSIEHGYHTKLPSSLYSISIRQLLALRSLLAYSYAFYQSQEEYANHVIRHSRSLNQRASSGAMTQRGGGMTALGMGFPSHPSSAASMTYFDPLHLQSTPSTPHVGDGVDIYNPSLPLLLTHKGIFLSSSPQFSTVTSQGMRSSLVTEYASTWYTSQPTSVFLSPLHVISPSESGGMQGHSSSDSGAGTTTGSGDPRHPNSHLQDHETYDELSRGTDSASLSSSISSSSPSSVLSSTFRLEMGSASCISTTPAAAAAQLAVAYMERLRHQNNPLIGFNSLSTFFHPRFSSVGKGLAGGNSIGSLTDVLNSSVSMGGISNSEMKYITQLYQEKLTHDAFIRSRYQQQRLKIQKAEVLESKRLEQIEHYRELKSQQLTLTWIDRIIKPLLLNTSLYHLVTQHDQYMKKQATNGGNEDDPLASNKKQSTKSKSKRKHTNPQTNPANDDNLCSTEKLLSSLTTEVLVTEIDIYHPDNSEILQRAQKLVVSDSIPSKLRRITWGIGLTRKHNQWSHLRQRTIELLLEKKRAEYKRNLEQHQTEQRQRRLEMMAVEHSRSQLPSGHRTVTNDDLHEEDAIISSTSPKDFHKHLAAQNEDAQSISHGGTHLTSDMQSTSSHDHPHDAILIDNNAFTGLTYRSVHTSHPHSTMGMGMGMSMSSTQSSTSSPVSSHPSSTARITNNNGLYTYDMYPSEPIDVDYLNFMIDDSLADDHITPSSYIALHAKASVCRQYFRRYKQHSSQVASKSAQADSPRAACSTNSTATTTSSPAIATGDTTTTTNSSVTEDGNTGGDGGRTGDDHSNAPAPFTLDETELSLVLTPFIIKSFNDIDVDLSRTFPHLAFFKTGSPMKVNMRNVLDCYCLMSSANHHEGAGEHTSTTSNDTLIDGSLSPFNSNSNSNSNTYSHDYASSTSSTSSMSSMSSTAPIVIAITPKRAGRIVGYVQGLSFLVGKMLLYMDENLSFCSLSSLMSTQYFCSFFSLGAHSITIPSELLVFTPPSLMIPMMPSPKASPQDANPPMVAITTTLDLRYQLFLFMLSDIIPDLYNHFAEMGMLEFGKSIFFLDWAMTWFGKKCELDLTSRLWDILVFNNESYVYIIGIALLMCMKRRLLQCPLEGIHKALSANIVLSSRVTPTGSGSGYGGGIAGRSGVASGILAATGISSLVSTITNTVGGTGAGAGSGSGAGGPSDSDSATSPSGSKANVVEIDEAQLLNNIRQIRWRKAYQSELEKIILLDLEYDFTGLVDDPPLYLMRGNNNGS